MFLPFSGDHPVDPGERPRAVPGEQAKPVSRRRRRRKHLGDPDGPADGDERAESETPTLDPEIDPDQHLPRARPGGALPDPVPLHPGRREGPRRDLLPDRTPGAASSNDDRLLGALKSLVNAKGKQDDDWVSLSGPQRGVRWRGGTAPLPPAWRYDRDDLRAYSKFVKKIEIWKLQVAPYMSKKEMALALYNSLQGEAEQELEHTPISEIYVEDGVDKIAEALRSPMEQKMVYQKRKFLSEFENLRRYSGETMRSFVNRFRRTQRCLRSVGVDVSLTYDAESMGARLLDRSGLSQEGQRLILVGTQQRLDFEVVVESMLLQYPEFRGAPPVVGRDGTPVTSKGSKGSKGNSKGSSRSTSFSSTSASSHSSSTASSGKGGGFHRKVHFTEADGDNGEEGEEEFLDPIDEGDEQEDHDRDDGDDGEQELLPDGDGSEDGQGLADLAEVLTLTAKKLSSLTLGRKFTGRPAKSPKGNGKSGKSSSGSSAADRKKVTHCSACGALGHWHEDPECPLNGGGSSNREKTTSQQPRSSPTTSKPHKVGILHHQHGATEISTPSTTSYGNMFTVNMVNRFPGPPFWDQWGEDQWPRNVCWVYGSRHRMPENMLRDTVGRSSHFAPQRVWTSPQDVGLSGFVQVWQGDTFTCNYQGVLSIRNRGSTFTTGIINPQWADSLPGFKLLADGSGCSFQLGEWYNCFQKAWRCEGKDISSWRSYGNLHFRLSNRWAFKIACMERTFRRCHLGKPSSGVHSELSNSWS